MPFPIDEKYIIQTEEKLEVTFPEIFRTKMMALNGGEIEAGEDVWQLYPFFDSSDSNRIKRTCNDIVHETNQAKQWRSFPENGVAIAGNGEGDQIVFLRDTALPNQLLTTLYQWNHETGELAQLEDFF